MDGLIVVDKPAGLTSFDVVRRVRGIVRQHTGIKKVKVGHTGTLDPFATGVLPVAIGRATRLAQFLIEGDKRYRATLRLGIATTTDDTEGEVLREADVSALTDAVISQALLSWLGPHAQVPPTFSAIKIDGKRAYDEARAGRPMELPPRDIVIHALEILDITLPDVVFEVTASKGTYIRSICRDVGIQLGVGGHCLALRRLDAAGFSEAETIELETLSTAESITALRCLEMLRDLPCVRVDDEAATILRNGGWIPAPEGCPETDPFTVTTDGRGLLCVGRWEAGRLKPVRVIDA